MRVSLVAIAKDEGRFLLEWLAHYIAIGVDHIFLFDNDSSDRTGEIVRSVAKKFPITYMRWPTPPNASPQVAAYNYAIKRLIAGFDWACFFDCDEFLVLNQDATVQAFLERYDSRIGALALNWLTFGSSGRENGDYDLVTDAFRFGGLRTWGNNRHVKTIARVKQLTRMGVHCASLKRGAYIHPDGQPLVMPVQPGKATYIDHSLAQLNHYQIKSKADFIEKIGRGRAGKKPNDPTRFRENPEAFFARLDRNVAEYGEIDATRDARMAIISAMRGLLAGGDAPRRTAERS